MWTLSSPQNRETLEQIPLSGWDPDYASNFQSLRVLEGDEANVIMDLTSVKNSAYPPVIAYIVHMHELQPLRKDISQTNSTILPLPLSFSLKKNVHM